MRRDRRRRRSSCDRGDFLARAHKSELDRRFGRPDVLQYVYAAGAFVGAVRGHWGFKPFDIDDVVIELSAAAATALREEVLALVRAAYPNIAEVRRVVFS